MSRVRQAGNPKRTTISLDADTQAALKWLRGYDVEPADRVSASRLLRDAAHEALAKHGRRVYNGEVLTIEESGRRMEADFRKRLGD